MSTVTTNSVFSAYKCPNLGYVNLYKILDTEGAGRISGATLVTYLEHDAGGRGGAVVRAGGLQARQGVFISKHIRYTWLYVFILDSQGCGKMFSQIKPYLHI